MKIEPQGNRVLVELEPYELERDGIQLIESHKEVQQTGVVVGVGEGTMTPNGVVTPQVSIGDRVIVTQTGGTMIDDGGKKYQITTDRDIVGVIG